MKALLRSVTAMLVAFGAIAMPGVLTGCGESTTEIPQASDPAMQEGANAAAQRRQMRIQEEEELSAAGGGGEEAAAAPVPEEAPAQ